MRRAATVGEIQHALSSLQSPSTRIIGADLDEVVARLEAKLEKAQGRKRKTQETNAALAAKRARDRA